MCSMGETGMQLKLYLMMRCPLKSIVGKPMKGRHGLGMNTDCQWHKASQKEKHKLVQEEIKEVEEGMRTIRSAAKKQQGAWLNWEGAQTRKRTWNELWIMKNDIYDLLPSPSNLRIWGVNEDLKCKLCGKYGTPEHIYFHQAKSIYRWSLLMAS